MVHRKISRDVKITALNLYEHGQLSLKDILAFLELWCTTGDVVPYKKSSGRPRLLHHDDVQYLLRLVSSSPDWFLDELRDLLQTNRFIAAHFTTIHRELEHAGMSLKFLKILAQERSEPTHLDYARKNDKTPGHRRGIVASTVVEGSMKPPFMFTVSWSLQCSGDGQCPHPSRCRGVIIM
ncbi:hypothetical protein B0H17DRAFT_1163035 [Mycena rosella]|uniref:Uncharacterized protein n=1 Tax=Mycena rosella TaxID=1033263 RepID=A0AAD7CT01_MYCRO|nr:hypothetical protein B0H17DRAFT_1163035 [Mycena rosella]